MSNNYFGNVDLETEYNSNYDKKKCQEDHVLRYIPLFYRNILHAEITSFLDKLSSTSSSEVLELVSDSDALPQVHDELLISRLKLHIQAALNVSPYEDGIKAILVIERALQIIGESIKPPSSCISCVSFLLRSCLTLDLQNGLLNLRNDILSHYRDNSAYGRLIIESNTIFFYNLQQEIMKIKECFEIVDFTQLLRIEQSVMLIVYKTIGEELEKDVKRAFVDNYVFHTRERTRNYYKNHLKCVQLLCDTISDLRKHTENARSKDVLLSEIKTIEYLGGFILSHKLVQFMKGGEESIEALKMLLESVKNFIKQYQNQELDTFKNELLSFLSTSTTALFENNPRITNLLSAPTIESFFTSLKEILFIDNEKSQIKTMIICAYEEAIVARNKLNNMFNEESYVAEEQLEEWLRKILFPVDTVDKLRKFFHSKKRNPALKELRKVCLSKETLEDNIAKMLEKGSSTEGYSMILLTKITYQKYLNSKFYASVELSPQVQKKLEYFLTKKVRLLITRLQAIKNILIEEDEEINEIWIWGRSKAIEFHKKFLMRQRYMKDITVRAALDMAFLDCANILDKNSLKELYEKTTDLFSGIDLRNVVAHRTNIPETIGAILDEDDFPSAMIDKMLKLIDDSDATEAMLELFPVAGDLQKDNFVNWVENSECEIYAAQIKTIKDCERWDKYLFLFPFI